MEWQLLAEILPAYRLDQESPVLRRTRDTLNELGVAEEQSERILKALETHFTLPNERGVSVFVSEAQVRTRPPADSWRFFIVSPGTSGDASAQALARRIELYLYGGA